MYQHDINQNELKKKLSYVIEDVVNFVGININTASEYLLKEVSGLNKTNAKKIVQNKPYKTRAQLKKILSEKAYQQAAGFLRVPESSEKFDNTSIHPEQYEIAKYIIENKITNLNQHEQKLKQLLSQITQQTIDDIITAYNQMGQDPRKHEATLKMDKTITIENLKEGDILDGVVRNIMQFGAFIDIGLKNDGLVHISELADKFVKDPHEIVEVGQQVKVKIIKIDLINKKTNLSMKEIE